MKKTLIYFSIIGALISCEKDDSETPIPNEPNVATDTTELIYYVSDDPKSENIYSIKADGQERKSLTNFTNNGANVYTQEIDFRNDKISFICNKDDSTKLEIFTMNADGSNITKVITTNSVDGPEISPNGNIILYSAKSSTNPTRYNLFTIGTDGSNNQQITDLNNSSNFIYVGVANWSNDGSKIIFTSDVNSNEEEIYSINSDGTNLQQLTNDGFYKYNPQYSPDGEKILFEGKLDSTINGYNLYTVDKSGNNLNQLTFYNKSSDFLYTGGASWSRNGDKIAFVSNIDGDDNELYVMNSDGSNIIQLTNDNIGQDYTTWK